MYFFITGGSRLPVPAGLAEVDERVVLLGKRAEREPGSGVGESVGPRCMLDSIIESGWEAMIGGRSALRSMQWLKRTVE